MTHRTKEVRRLLSIHRDGLTPTEVVLLTGMPYSTAHNAMTRQPDVYIDRWVPSINDYRWVPVFCLHAPPVDSPKPRIKVKDYLKTMEAL